MRESVGGFSLFNIVIVFVLLFTGYISLSINHSKAYNVKNEILNIIRNNGGVCAKDGIDICENFKEQITDFFQEANYRSTGSCPAGWYGYGRDGSFLGEAHSNAVFCVNAVAVNTSSELPNALYYQIKVFYQLDLPIISSFFDFSVKGETSRIYSSNECKYMSSEYRWC